MIDEKTTPLLLQYWLNCIQYEEALSIRPRAIRTSGILPEYINLRDPTERRLYFKLEMRDVAILLSPKIKHVVCPLDGEVNEFFESWLMRQYKRFHTDTGELEIMVACPAVHLPSDELTGLFRFGVSLSFQYLDGQPFVVPKPRHRKSGKLPLPPDIVKIKRLEKEEGGSFFVDGRLLSRQLGLTESEMSDVFDACRTRDVQADDPLVFMSGLCRSFTGEELSQEQASDPTVLLGILQGEMKNRFAAWSVSSKVYPVGIAFDAGRVKTTFHLRRELKIVIGADLEADRPVLHAYLKGDALDAGDSECLGLFHGTDMTRSQGIAAGRFLGSSLTALQGPPGTGKTTLIHHLAAHSIVARVAALEQGAAMPDDILVVCSTNNRAVDNAVEPLSGDLRGDVLPLALRAGSRRVCEKVLKEQLASALYWLTGSLKGTTVEQRKTNLEDSLSEFRKTRDALMVKIGPRLRRDSLCAEKRELEKELKDIKRDLGDLPQFERQPLRGLDATVAVLGRLEKSLEELSAKTEGKATKKKNKSVARFYTDVIERVYQKADKALLRFDLNLTLDLPPDVKDCSPELSLEKWEDAAEDGLDKLYPLIEKLRQQLDEMGKTQRAGVLEDRIKEMRIPSTVNIDEDEVSRLKHVLFERAVKVREAYVLEYGEAFVDTLKDACAAVEDQSSLRQFARTNKTGWRRLTQMFPVWGCTLLSMGNVFGDSPGSIDRVIIDEAGQCHPAYAVSALMRCRSALVTGDVHQLTPVFGLAGHDEKRLQKNLLGKKGSLDELYRVYDRSQSSVQAIAEHSDNERLSLTDHFRCQPEIIGVSDILCGYDLKVHTEKKSRLDQASFLTHPIMFMPVEGNQERQGGSWHNPGELNIVIATVSRLLNSGLVPEDVAVITPYRAQMYALRRTLLARGLPVEPSPEMLELEQERHQGLLFAPKGIALGTVHRFQGGERSVVLFSSVVTNPKSLPFLNDRVNLLNVAISRAKEHFIIIGQERALVRGTLTRKLLRCCHTVRL